MLADKRGPGEPSALKTRNFNHSLAHPSTPLLLKKLQKLRNFLNNKKTLDNKKMFSKDVSKYNPKQQNWVSIDPVSVRLVQSGSHFPANNDFSFRSNSISRVICTLLFPFQSRNRNKPIGRYYSAESVRTLKLEALSARFNQIDRHTVSYCSVHLFGIICCLSLKCRSSLQRAERHHNRAARLDKQWCVTSRVSQRKVSRQLDILGWSSAGKQTRGTALFVGNGVLRADQITPSCRRLLNYFYL